MIKKRNAEVQRSTKETTIRLSLLLDGRGRSLIDTPYTMFNHLLSSMVKFSSIDLSIKAREVTRSDEHHLVEDVAICLGQALDKALANRLGIARYGFAITPMDECLVLSSVDLSGRGGCYHKLPFRTPRMGDLPTSLVPHFFASFAINGRFTLHLGVLRRGDDHHMAEGLFKSVGLSFNYAFRVTRGDLPSTKGML
jgi:imidazoleglycerol phosphate dehydratase HisB